MTTPTIVSVPVDSLIFRDNVRSAACLNVPSMVESLKRHGFLENHPLVVSKKDNGYLVLCGNRRGLGATFLRDNDNAAFCAVFPDYSIPAIVHEGLTPEEEVLLRIDHSSDMDREPLDEWSLFQAIRQLQSVGMDTQEEIAIKLGIFHTKGKNVGQPNRSYIQPRANVARMPRFVQDEYEKYCTDRNSTAFRISMIGGKAGLFATYQLEYMDFPAGDGPLFSKAWQDAITPKVSDDDGKPVKYSLTPKVALDKSQLLGSVAIKEVLLAATGQGKEPLEAVDQRLQALESDRKTLEILKWHIGDDFPGIVKEATDAWVDYQDEIAATQEEDKETVETVA
jgi:hypothetical protein